MRVDAHIHYMPPSLAKDLDSFCQDEPYWGLLIGPQDGNSIQGWASPERTIEDMDRAGIDIAVIQGEYRRRHQACVTRNDQALDLVRRWPDRFVAFATLQPKAGQMALDELKRCLDGGLRGVGELNPYGQGHTLDDPDFLRMVEACIDFDIPLNLHVSEEIGHYYPGKSTTPLRHYYRLACRYPRLKLILAHWGGGLFFYEIMPKVKRDLRNVYYDTAASPLLYPSSTVFRTAIECVDHHKILMGSDYPLLLYPGRQPEPDFRPFLAQIDEIELPPGVYRDIMGGNAARLLNLGQAADQTQDVETLHPDSRAPAPEHKTPRKRYASLVIVDPPEGKEPEIIQGMAVSMVAEHWPQTRDVFEKYGIPWHDSPVPFWEPIIQAAAARGLGPSAQRRLLDELNEAAGRTGKQDRDQSAP